MSKTSSERQATAATGQINDVVTMRDTARFVWRYWRRTPKAVAVICAGVCGAVMFDIALPGVSRGLTEAVQTGNHLKAALMLGTFLGCGIGFALTWQWGYRRLCRDTIAHMQSVSAEAFGKVQQASADWHANSFAGSTVRKITRGMHAFDMFSDTIVTGFLPTTVLVIGSIAVMLVHWPLMGLATLASTSAYVTGAVLMSLHYIVPSSRKANKEDTALSAALADSVTCNSTVKCFGAEQREEAEIRRTLAQWGHVNLDNWLRRQDMYLAMTLLSLLNQLALLGVPVWLWSKGQAGPAEVAYGLTAFYLMGGAIRQVHNHVQSLQRATSDLEDVVRIDRMALGVADLAGAQPARITQGDIRFAQVGFRYAGQEKAIYDGLDLHIRPGEKVGLVGASGSGKSTLVKLLQRLYDVTDGQVLVDGQDVRTLTQSSLRARIALVPQEPVLFHRSLAENIRYGRPDASLDEVIAAAKEAHAHTFIARLPSGYDTLVGERGIKLSGGERQRVAIARAILADAPVLVLDEATSSLDSISEAVIQEALDRLMDGRTTLIVAHRLSTLRAVDRILVFHQGRIVEQGSHTELLAREGGHYRQLFQTQQLGLIAQDSEALTI